MLKTKNTNLEKKTKRFINRKETGNSQRDIFEEFKCCLLIVKIMHKLVQKFS